MHHYKHLILICFLINFLGCKKAEEIIFTDTNITNTNNTIIEINVPQASGNKTVANKINSEITKTIISSLHIGNSDEVSSTSIEESITNFTNEFNDFQNDFPETSQQWEAQIDGEIMFQSPKLTSIAITSFTNTGGAHGNLIITFLNFNSKTGKRLKNTDLFTNIDAFNTLAKSHFISATTYKSLMLDTEVFILPKNIGYSENGVILLYNTYEIAPYSSGVIEFAIPFNEVENYLVFNSSH